MDFRFSVIKNRLIIYLGHREALCECKLEMDIRKKTHYSRNKKMKIGIKKWARNKKMGL